MFIFIVTLWGLLILFRLESKMRQVQESLDRIEAANKRSTKPLEPLTEAQKQAAAAAFTKQPAAKKPVAKSTAKKSGKKE